MNVGAELRKAREARGLTVAALSSRTRIHARVLDGLERNDLSAVPPPPYARGFVASYAREVGLSPDHIVRDYFAQFDGPAGEIPQPPPDAQTRASESRHRSWVPTVALACGLLVLAAFLMWSPETAEREAAAVGTSGTASAPTGNAPASGLAAPEPPPGPADTLSVVLETEHAAWIAASVDGTRVLYRTLPAGTKETLRASREIALRVGDAGAVRLSVNGGQPELMGSRGQVRDVTVRRDDEQAR